MIGKMLNLLLSFTIVSIAFKFNLSIISTILLLIPALALGVYLNGHIEVNGKRIKPFYIK